MRMLSFELCLAEERQQRRSKHPAMFGLAQTLRLELRRSCVQGNGLKHLDVAKIGAANGCRHLLGSVAALVTDTKV